jgi:hypothetical protein
VKESNGERTTIIAFLYGAGESQRPWTTISRNRKTMMIKRKYEFLADFGLDDRTHRMTIYRINRRKIGAYMTFQYERAFAFAGIRYLWS